MSDFKKKSFFNLSANLLSSFFLFLSFVFYARFLGVSSFGIFQIEYLLLAVLPIIFISFTDYALAYYIGKSKNTQEKSLYFSLSLNISYLIGFLYLMFLWLFKDFLFFKIFHIDKNLNTSSTWLLLYFSLYFLGQIFINNVKSLMLGESDIKERFKLIFLHRFFLAFLSVFLLFFFKKLRFIGFGYCITLFFSFSYIFYYLQRKKIFYVFSWQKNKLKNFFQYG